MILIKQYLEMPLQDKVDIFRRYATANFLLDNMDKGHYPADVIEYCLKINQLLQPENSHGGRRFKGGKPAGIERIIDILEGYEKYGKNGRKTARELKISQCAVHRTWKTNGLSADGKPKKQKYYPIGSAHNLYR